MDETLKGVAEFHKAFGLGVAPAPYMPEMTDPYKTRCRALAAVMEAIANGCLDEAESTKNLPANTIFLRLQLIQSEVAELAEALAEGNIVATLDALTDIQYVLDGTYLALGLQDLKLPAFREVQRSNMTKLGADGQPILNDAGRVVKGSNYEPPKLKELMYLYMYGGVKRD